MKVSIIDVKNGDTRLEHTNCLKHVSRLENVHCFTQNVKHIRTKLSQSPTQRIQKAIAPVVALRDRATTHLSLVPR
jgi:hypothetical protein